MGEMPTADEWSRLTLAGEKRRAFSEDLYFREAWVDLTDALGDSAVDFLTATGLLTFKPESVVGRRMRPTLDFLTERDFVPIGVRQIRYTRHSMRELWRYNWDVYPVDRLEMATAMHSSVESLLWLLRDTSYSGAVPGAVRLSDLKGSAEAVKRTDRHLRQALDPPNDIINFVHVADEPADVVRELAIFLDRDERRELLAEIGDRPAGQAADAAEYIAQLEARYPAHDLSFEPSLRRLAESVDAGDEAVARLRAAAGGGVKLRWDELRSIADPLDPSVDVWDFATVASEVLPDLREGSKELLPNAGIDDWSAAPAGATGGSG